MKLYSEALKELEIEQAKAEKKFNNEHSILLMAIHKLYPEIHSLVKEEKTVNDIKEKFKAAWSEHHNGYYWVEDLSVGEPIPEIAFINFIDEKIVFIGIDQIYNFSYENIVILSPKLTFDGNNSERAKRESDW